MLRVAGTWRRDGTSAAVAAPVDMVPPEVFAEARRVAQRDALVTVRHVVPLESPLQEAVEAGDGAPPRPPEQQPAKLLLFLVHSRLPRVAAITAVQCDAALLSPEHHQVDPRPTPSPGPSPNLDPNPNPNPGTTRSYSSCSWWAPRRSLRWRAHAPERCSGGTAETHESGVGPAVGIPPCRLYFARKCHHDATKTISELCRERRRRTRLEGRLARSSQYSNSRLIDSVCWASRTVSSEVQRWTRGGTGERMDHRIWIFLVCSGECRV